MTMGRNSRSFSPPLQNDKTIGSIITVCSKTDFSLGKEIIGVVRFGSGI